MGFTNLGEINPYDSEGKLQILIDLVKDYVPLAKWGFTKSTQFPGSPRDPLACVIYNSEACRVKFSFDYSANGRKLDVRVYYGRLHAPDNESEMQWHGERCYCWHHRLDILLPYLDGMSPQQAAAHDREPQGIQEFLSLGLPLATTPQPEWFVRMHAFVWEYYGSRFFQLFDLQHPEIWEQFARFVSDCYDIWGRQPALSPSLDKIC